MKEGEGFLEGKFSISNHTITTNKTNKTKGEKTKNRGISPFFSPFFFSPKRRGERGRVGGREDFG